MEEVVRTVDIELSKEETIILYKAKLILKELGIRLRKIETKRKPYSENLVNEALEKVAKTMCCFGTGIDDGEDSEVKELDDKFDKLEEMEKE